MGRLNVSTLLVQCLHFIGIRSHLQTNSLRVRSEAPKQLLQGELLQGCPSATLLILLILITEELNGKKIITLLSFLFSLGKKKESWKLSYCYYNHKLQNMQSDNCICPLTCRKALGFSSYVFWL